MRWLAPGLLAFALSLAACTTVKVAGECPDTQSLRCLTEKVCSPDRDRGCQVCRCAPPRYVPLEAETYPRPAVP